jgi:hypothetical protein
MELSIDQFKTDSRPVPSQSARGLYERGEEFLFGMGHARQDFDEARECFEDAAKLGLGRAFWRLGWMRFRGQGCPKNPLGGVGIWQAGAKAGDRFCWGELGAAFTASKDQTNARAAWREFFESSEIYDEQEEELEIGWLVCRYIDGHLRHGLPMDFLSGIKCFQTEARHGAEEAIATCRRKLGAAVENDQVFKIATAALEFLDKMAVRKGRSHTEPLQPRQEAEDEVIAFR